VITIKEVKKDSQNDNIHVVEAVENGVKVAVGRFVTEQPDTITLKHIEWDIPENLDGVVRTALYAAMCRGCQNFSIEKQDEKTYEALRALDIPAHGSLQMLFSGVCKGGCVGDCKNCRG
jgi:hypothetical protein